MKGWIQRWPYYSILIAAVLASLAQVTRFPGGLHLPVEWFGWLAWVGVAPFLAVLYHQDWKKALGFSLLFFFLYYSFTLYWLNIAVAIYGGLPWIVSLLMVMVLMIMITTLMAPGLVVGLVVARRFRIPHWICFATAWVAVEYIRLHSYTHFPWANLSDAQPFVSLRLAQIADVTGHNGVTWLLVAVNTVVAETILGRSQWRSKLAVGALVLAAMTYGSWRLQETHMPQPLAASNGDVVKIAALQGNIAQEEKWDQNFRMKIIRTYETLLVEAAEQGADIVVWPEASFPFLLDRTMKKFPLEFPIAKQYNLLQVIGASSQKGKELFNSAFLVAPDGQVLDAYDKTQLVPMGEYVPFKRIFFFIDRIVPAIADFSPGAVARPVEKGEGVENYRLGVLLCYEDVFPNVSGSQRRLGADLLLNLTNDAWYGTSSAAFQHLGISAYRAIENRLPLLRATNTGITAFVGPSGRVHQQLDWFTPGILIAEIPKASLENDRLTFYSRFGDWFPQWALVLMVSAWLSLIVLRKRMGYAAIGNPQETKWTKN